jgi:hypothetical protein
MPGNVDAVLRRLLAIDWQIDDRRTRSHVVLLREYLRRAATFAERLGCPDAWPFFDIAGELDPDVRAPDATLDALRGALALRPLHSKVVATCEWALHWAALEDADPARMRGLPAPYEPLLILYERSGRFTTEHGFFQVGLASLRRGTAADHLTTTPREDLSPAALDALDR